jgi:hypothetical protein
LNTFLNQSPILDSKGCPTYATADVIFVPNTVSVTPPACPDLNFSISFSIQNTGDIGLSGNLPITFYNGDPLQAGAVKLGSTTISLNNFNVGDIINVTNLAVPGNGGTFSLYTVLNDNGSTVPTPIIFPNTSFAECNYFNNIISTTVTPSPFQLQSNVISDNFKCGVGPSTPNCQRFLGPPRCVLRGEEG